MALQNEKKAAIRERYKGVDPSLLEVIPATAPETMAVEDRTLNVAAYIRVSTDNDEQTSSFELQQNDFTERIQANPKWNFVGIYSDEGISGTELSHRKGMLQMLEDCRAGKIDYILAKSIARFARNVVDCLSIIEELKNMNPPVGVYFEADNLYTLDSTGALVLTIMATLAEEESRNKSVIMNWSIDQRFSRGIFLTPELLGYDRDENGELVVNPQEAETVKVIYDLFVNGWSATEIADLLTQYGRTTKTGNTEWSASSISGIIGNERHCGDILARKELERTYSHEGYSVIRKELFPHLRDPAMTIRNGTITFNTACINGLEDVVYVKFEINEELKRLAIKPCDENDRNAVRWCVAKPDKRKTRYIKCPDVTDKIFELMEWNKAYRYKILAYMIAPEGVNFYIFDLLIWERTKIGSRRKIENGPETSDAMEPIEGSETQTKNENAPTDEQKFPASKPPIGERFSSEVAGSFGESVDQLQRDTEVKEIDGFVTMDLITGSRQPRE